MQSLLNPPRNLRSPKSPHQPVALESLELRQLMSMVSLPLTVGASNKLDEGLYAAGTVLHITATGHGDLVDSRLQTKPDGSLYAPAQAPYSFANNGASYSTVNGGDGINHFVGGGLNYDSGGGSGYGFAGKMTTDTTDKAIIRDGVVVGTFKSAPTRTDWFAIGSGVNITVPAGGAHLYLAVNDSHSPSNHGTYAITLAAGNASIAGTIYNDTNANGLLNTGETGLAGIKVYLDNNKNGVLDSTEPSVLTDSAGKYKFAGLLAGTFRVRQVPPTNRKITAPSVGYFDVTLSSTTALTGKNFFDALATSVISGRVFGDSNNNAKRDVGEVGLGLFTVYLDLNHNGKLDTGDVSRVTDILGNFSFTGLIAGSYTVRIVPVTGLTTTTPAGGTTTITLVAGQTSTSTLFGERSIT